MPTWALAVAAAVFLAALTAFALVFTRTHPNQQENPWQPEQQPSSPTAPRSRP